MAARFNVRACHDYVQGWERFAMYRVKEIYLTIQGEGVHTGRRAVFLRFAGCNLWSGREADRKSAVCRFCDTDFVGMKKKPATAASVADGSVNKKTYRQLKNSIARPPSVGPIAGANTMPIEYKPMASPRC